MANNRLYIRCCNCGETMFLAKHFLGPWDCRYKDKDLREFIENHFVDCIEDYKKYGDEDSWFNQLELVTDFGEGFPKIIENEIINGKYYTKVIRSVYG